MARREVSIELIEHERIVTKTVCVCVCIEGGRTGGLGPNTQYYSVRVVGQCSIDVWWLTAHGHLPSFKVTIRLRSDTTEYPPVCTEYSVQSI
jgi:hypothetical protein